MKKIILENKLAFGAGLAVVVLLVAVSYADNLSKLGNVPASSPLAALAQEITTAYSSSVIANKGIANSLASKVMDAQKALDSSNKDAAVAKLNDLISEVNAQTKKEYKKGKNIPSEEAAILITKANAAINAIQNPATACNGTIMGDGTCCTERVIYPGTPDERCIAA